MASAQAKLFEWQRVDADVQRVRAALKDAVARGESDNEVARLDALLRAAEERSRVLLAELHALRAARS